MEGKPDLVMADGQQGLHVTNLRKSYRRRPVIRDVTLSLNRGEVVALLGPNGSGKTTCFYSIAGLVTPEGGTVMLDGQDVTRFPMYRRAKAGIGYLPQEMSIFRGLTVEANIMAILEITEKHRHQRHERLEELLSDFSISHLRAAPALSLSGGNAAAPRSPAAWPRTRATCCWMNPSRASIPSRWRKFGAWSRTSRSAGLAC